MLQFMGSQRFRHDWAREQHKDQVESMITDIKNTLERLKNISEQAGRINELGNRSTKIIQSSKRKKKNKEK